MKPIIRIAITGGAGQIAYQLLFRIASGEVFGPSQAIDLRILELSDAMPALEGVKMELQDCAFPLLQNITITSNPFQAFENVDYAFLIGAKPRSQGMERKDLLLENAKIFTVQGKALNESANENAKIFVIGNPCNTNCLIAMSQAPRLPRINFCAMTRLDQNRAAFFLANKAGVSISDVANVTIWGNHSSTQVPDFLHARIKGNPVENFIDRNWLENDFFALIQKRGAEIIKARGKSSAGSAAQAIMDSARDILFPTPVGQWFSSAIDSTTNPYGIQEGLVFSFPCYMKQDGTLSIVQDLEINAFLRKKIKETELELLEERDLIRSLI